MTNAITALQVSVASKQQAAFASRVQGKWQAGQMASRANGKQQGVFALSEHAQAVELLTLLSVLACNLQELDDPTEDTCIRNQGSLTPSMARVWTAGTTIAQHLTNPLPAILVSGTTSLLIWDCKCSSIWLTPSGCMTGGDSFGPSSSSCELGLLPRLQDI